MHNAICDCSPVPVRGMGSQHISQEAGSDHGASFVLKSGETVSFGLKLVKFRMSQCWLELNIYKQNQHNPCKNNNKKMWSPTARKRHQPCSTSAVAKYLRPRFWCCCKAFKTRQKWVAQAPSKLWSGSRSLDLSLTDTSLPGRNSSSVR